MAGSRTTATPEPDTFDLWLAFADYEPDPGVLTAAEQDRLSLLKSSAARWRFAAARTLLRHRLAEATGVAPESLILETSTTGKPGLARSQNTTGLAFSVSHSDQAVAVLIGSRPCGVDLEVIGRPPRQRLVDRVLHPNELSAWQRLPESERTAAFVQAWSRKEAVVKAAGLGVWRGLGDLETGFAGGIDPVPATFSTDRYNHPRGGATAWSHERWHVLSVTTGEPALCAAVAAPGADWAVKPRLAGSGGKW